MSRTPSTADQQSETRVQGDLEDVFASQGVMRKQASRVLATNGRPFPYSGFSPVGTDGFFYLGHVMLRITATIAALLLFADVSAAHDQWLITPTTGPRPVWRASPQQFVSYREPSFRPVVL